VRNRDATRATSANAPKRTAAAISGAGKPLAAGSGPETRPLQLQALIAIDFAQVIDSLPQPNYHRIGRWKMPFRGVRFGEARCLAIFLAGRAWHCVPAMQTGPHKGLRNNFIQSVNRWRDGARP
jgi:hypothetical protein